MAKLGAKGKVSRAKRMENLSDEQRQEIASKMRHSGSLSEGGRHPVTGFEMEAFLG